MSETPRSPYFKYQVRVFALTWLSYASYYLTRKHFSVVKGRLQSDHGLSKYDLGWIDTAYLTSYAVGQFVNGALGDRMGPRRLLSIGMIGSAIVSLAMSFSPTFSALFLLFGINGLLQSTGWPNNVKAMSPWFTGDTRGKIMGVWCTNYQVGGIVATALATYLLGTYGWQWAFRIPAAWVSAVGLAVLLLLVERPLDCGLASLNEADGEGEGGGGAAADRDEDVGFKAMIRHPAVWSLGGAYFGLKLIRYSLLFWLPLYLSEGLKYGEETAGYLSTSFEAGGVIGAIVTGWLSDRFFPGRRARLLVPMMFGLALALGLYRLVGDTGLGVNALTMGLVGILLYGPDSLISGAAAQDVGGGRSAASAAGIINGIGSVGAMLQGLLTAFVADQFGWGAVFYVFIVFAVISALALVPMALRERRPAT